MTRRYFTHRHNVSLNDLMMISPVLGTIHTLFVLFCWLKKYPIPEITSGINENVKRVSTTHRDGRALDYSSKIYSKVQIKGILKHFNEKYSDFGAISYNDGKSRVIVYHDSGHGKHFHMQVRRKKHISKEKLRCLLKIN